VIKVTHQAMQALADSCNAAASEVRHVVRDVGSSVDDAGPACGIGPAAGALGFAWSTWRGHLVELAASLEDQARAVSEASRQYQTADEKTIPARHGGPR
jgi:uncharacterized protein YukE